MAKPFVVLHLKTIASGRLSVTRKGGVNTATWTTMDMECVPSKAKRAVRKVRFVGMEVGAEIMMAGARRVTTMNAARPKDARGKGSVRTFP
jgi:hypothetical protein